MIRVAVLGHVEHITLAAVPAMPHAGDIVHLAAPRAFPGGGGGVAFHQLLRGPTQVLLFTAVGGDDTGRFVATALAATEREHGAEIHIAHRDAAHTRDLVLVTPGVERSGPRARSTPAGECGSIERTIFVVGEPLHPRASDALPYDRIASCDAAYFTAQDPDLAVLARAARVLVVTARRREVLARSGVRADVVVGSLHDPRELSTLADYPVPPGALVLTDGPRGGQVETAAGIARFSSTPAPMVGAYGAGDSFAGALTFYLAAGLDVLAAATRAARHGAAVVAGLVPLENQLALTLP